MRAEWKCLKTKVLKGIYVLKGDKLEPSHNVELLYLCAIAKVVTNKSKGKGIPLQAWEGSWDSRRLRLLDLLDTRHYEGGKVVSLTHRPPSPPGSS